MKKMIPILLLLMLANSAWAVGLRLGVEANLMKPNATLALSEYTDGSFDPTGFGVTAFGMADLIFLKITGNVGYLNFGEQNFDFQLPGVPEANISASAKVTAVPVLVGLRWEFGLPVGPKPHIGIQAGVHNFTYTYEGSVVNQELVNETETTSEFSFAPVVGLRFAALDASLFYMIVKDFNYLGLRLGYTFGLGL